MKSKKKNKTRVGTVTDMVRLDFHDFFGRLIDRMKASTNDKQQGVIMLEKIQNSFDIKDSDRKKFREDMVKYQIEMRKETKYPKGMKPEKIEWTRDEHGKIISPFKNKQTSQ